MVAEYGLNVIMWTWVEWRERNRVEWLEPKHNILGRNWRNQVWYTQWGTKNIIFCWNSCDCDTCTCCFIIFNWSDGFVGQRLWVLQSWPAAVVQYVPDLHCFCVSCLVSSCYYFSHCPLVVGIPFFLIFISQLNSNSM